MILPFLIYFSSAIDADHKVVMFDKNGEPNMTTITDTMQYATDMKVNPFVISNMKRIIIATGCYNYIIGFA